ncbi:MAG: menaquinone biosynthetic enzyme MqnA/MqnD family protein [Phycisphaerales bacterium JB040]
MTDTSAPTTQSRAAPARIAAVSYLNTLPLIQGLDTLKGLELLRAVPANIVGMVQDGRADLGLASLIDYARSETPLALLWPGMIGCHGRTLTVRLFSAVPPERITTLHADTDSHTSVTLARVILAERYGVRPDVRDFDPREQTPKSEGDWPETLLLIGDKVVAGSPPAVRYPHQVDLGEAWDALTGLPFVYACWMCRADRVDDPGVETACRLLDRQRRRNAMRLDRIVTDAAPAHHWPSDLAREYLGSLMRYELGPRERAGAELFLAKSADLGLCERIEPNWVGVPSASLS